MNAKYDPEVDVLRINWSKSEIEESDAVIPGVILDSDPEGNVIGIGILNAGSKFLIFEPISNSKIKA